MPIKFTSKKNPMKKEATDKAKKILVDLGSQYDNSQSNMRMRLVNAYKKTKTDQAVHDKFIDDMKKIGVIFSEQSNRRNQTIHIEYDPDTEGQPELNLNEIREMLDRQKAEIVKELGERLGNELIRVVQRGDNPGFLQTFRTQLATSTAKTLFTVLKGAATLAVIYYGSTSAVVIVTEMLRTNLDVMSYTGSVVGHSITALGALINAGIGIRDYLSTQELRKLVEEHNLLLLQIQHNLINAPDPDPQQQAILDMRPISMSAIAQAPEVSEAKASPLQDASPQPRQERSEAPDASTPKAESIVKESQDRGPEMKREYKKFGRWDEDSLRAKYNELGYDGLIEYLGTVSKDDLKDYNDAARYYFAKSPEE